MTHFCCIVLLLVIRWHTSASATQSRHSSCMTHMHGSQGASFLCGWQQIYGVNLCCFMLPPACVWTTCCHAWQTRGISSGCITRKLLCGTCGLSRVRSNQETGSPVGVSSLKPQVAGCSLQASCTWRPSRQSRMMGRRASAVTCIAKLLVRLMRLI